MSELEARRRLGAFKPEEVDTFWWQVRWASRRFFEGNGDIVDRFRDEISKSSARIQLATYHNHPLLLAAGLSNVSQVDPKLFEDFEGMWLASSISNRSGIDIESHEPTVVREVITTASSEERIRDFSSIEIASGTFKILGSLASVVLIVVLSISIWEVGYVIELIHQLFAIEEPEPVRR